jgi:hypothetical protein
VSSNLAAQNSLLALRYGGNPLQHDYCLAASPHRRASHYFGSSNIMAAEHMGETPNLSHCWWPAHRLQGLHRPSRHADGSLRCSVPYCSSGCTRCEVFTESDKASMKAYVFYQSSGLGLFTSTGRPATSCGCLLLSDDGKPMSEQVYGAIVTLNGRYIVLTRD